MLRAYRPNRRRAWVTSVLVGLSTVLFAFGLLAYGLRDVALGVTLLSQGFDAYRAAMAEWVRTWQDVPGAAGVIGAFVMAAAGIAFLPWLVRSTTNLQALPDPDVRPVSGFAAVPLHLLFPTLVVIYYVVLSAYPYASAIHVVLFAAAAASLAGPLIVIRRLWEASSTRPGGGLESPVWGGILVWWAAFETAWVTQILAAAVTEDYWDAFRYVEAAIRFVASGLFQMASAAAVIVAAVFIIRIMFRVNAMQDAQASRLRQSTARPERGETGPVQRTTGQWQCESCDVLNPTALRFCQNCASERG